MRSFCSSYPAPNTSRKVTGHKFELQDKPYINFIFDEKKSIQNFHISLLHAMIFFNSFGS